MEIETLLSQWDGETVVVRHDRPTGAWIFIAVHSTRLGPATGGTRMKPYPDTEAALHDALRLSEGMTYKFAASGIPRGGGKAVIHLPAEFDPRSRPALLRRYGSLIKQLGGLFTTGPDVGTSDADMDLIAETGDPFVFGRTPAAGGAGATGPITAVGVFSGIQVISEHLFGTPSLQDRRVLVQGTGSVGGTLIRLLVDAGAEVLFNDVDEAAIRRYRDDLGLTFVPDGQVFTSDCHIFAPCALGGILNTETIHRLKCRAVAGGANNQLATPEDAERLRARGILYAPDYVVNVGAALAIPGIETMGWSQEKAEEQVTKRVQRTLRRILDLSSEKVITTEAAARLVAEERLSRDRPRESPQTVDKARQLP